MKDAVQLQAALQHAEGPDIGCDLQHPRLLRPCFQAGGGGWGTMQQKRLFRGPTTHSCEHRQGAYHSSISSSQVDDAG